MIVKSLANFISREHSSRPLGNVLTLGRQTVIVNQQISDKEFFAQYGSEVTSIDIQDADIIHNLNYPVPERLHNQFDFIVDGGTFDHLFDIRAAFENVVKMLKPDGRVLHMNAASNFTGASYLSFSPEFFYDYYTGNNFAVKVYLVEISDLAQKENWDLYEYKATTNIRHFVSPRIQMTIAIAEKYKDSTWDKAPIQYQYNSGRYRPVTSSLDSFKYVGRI